MNKKNTVIFHKNCIDGFAAAMVFYKRFNGQAKFIPAQYGEAVPGDLDGVIYIVDFSYSEESMRQILDNPAVEHVHLLDHHKTAILELSGIDHPKLTTYFAYDESGAMLAWDYCFQWQSPPEVLQWVADYDLWRFEKENTKAVNEYLRFIGVSMSNSLAIMTWQQWLSTGSTLTEQELAIGHALYQVKLSQAVDLAKNYRVKKINGYPVPVVNAPGHLANEVCELLYEQHDGPFVATYYDTRDSRKFSIRSSKSGIDVTEVARAFNGGGHAKAAGFSIPHGSKHPGIDL